MHPIADQLRIHRLGIQHHARDPRLAMIQPPHRIEHMRGRDSPRRNRRPRLRRRCIRVPQTHPHPQPHRMRGQFQRPRHLGSHGHQPDLPPRRLPHPRKQFHRGRLYLRHRMYPALGMRDKRTLQMYSNRRCTLTCPGFNYRSDPLQRPQRHLHRRRHRRCQKMPHAPRCQIAANPFQSPSRTFHHIVSGCSMDMHVEERRRQRTVASCLIRLARLDLLDHTIGVDGDPWPVHHAVRRNQPPSRDAHRTHFAGTEAGAAGIPRSAAEGNVFESDHCRCALRTVSTRVSQSCAARS